MTQTDAIVRYENPPITEVVVAVAFQPLPHLTVAHLGQFWRESLAAAFPQVEERPTYEPPLETFDGPSPAQLSLTLTQQFPPPRLWFKSADDQELLQVQRNWFACNWRKVSPEADYSHWPSRRDAFVQWFRKLEAFVSDNNLGKVSPTQCEVTYINHITPDSVWTRHGEIHRIFNHIDAVEGFLPEPEEFGFQSRYLMRASDNHLMGRLHVSAQPVIDVKDGHPAIALNLTARGAPEQEGIDGVIEMADRGREWIVRAFDALTTDAMHQSWGRLNRE